MTELGNPDLGIHVVDLSCDTNVSDVDSWTKVEVINPVDMYHPHIRIEMKHVTSRLTLEKSS